MRLYKIAVFISILIACCKISFAQATKVADSLLMAGSYQEAIEKYNGIIASDTNMVSALDRGNAYVRRGRCYFLVDQVDNAIQDYFKALSIFQTLNNIERLSTAYTNISSAYYQKFDYETADKYWNYAYEFSKDIKDSARILNLLSDKGIILFKSGKNAEAVTLFLNCIKNYRSVLDTPAYTQLYINLGNSYEAFNSDSSLYYYKTAEEIARATNDTSSLSIIFSNLGYVFLKKNVPQLALTYLQKGYGLSQKQSDIAKEANITYSLSVAYDSLKMYDSALNYLRKAMLLNDSIFDIEKSRYAGELSEKYESDRKDEKIRSQEIENKLKSRNLLLSLGGLALVAALAVVSLISYQRKQKANQLLKAQNEHIEKLNKELDASNQVKTKLFSVISHDLRGPVSSLYAYLQLKSNASDKTDKIIIEQTEQLLEDLEDLLVWSKSQLHQFVTFLQDIYLCEICNDVSSLLYTKALQNNNRIINHIAPALCIRSDVNILTIVLRNILSNAITYAIPGSPIEVNANTTQEQVIVTITNETGSENIHLLYSLQDDVVTSERSGLGLTLVKEFIVRLNGQLAYTIKQNKVTAVITLSLSDQPVIRANA